MLRYKLVSRCFDCGRALSTTELSEKEFEEGHSEGIYVINTVRKNWYDESEIEINPTNSSPLCKRCSED